MQANPTTPTAPRDIRITERVARLQLLSRDLKVEAGRLETDIAEEERQAGNKTDPTAFDYPMTARSMRSRLKNIRVSLATIEAELAKCAAADNAKAAA